jgi:hypothetical protein
MVNRSTIAVVLVVVTVLAGCSGILGDEGPGSPEEFEYADGYDAEGVTDGNAAAASYRQALTNKSSYTVTYRQNITGGGTNVTYEVTYRVDVEGEQAYHSVEVPSEEYLREDYFSNGTHASREVNDGDEQSASGDGEFPAEQLTGVDVVARLLSNETDYETSVAERDGTHVVVYETEGAENAAEVFAMDPANVSSFRAEFAVDSEGVVRDASYEIVYVGENDTEQTVTLEFEVRDVGSTSVQRPDWVNEA